MVFVKKQARGRGKGTDCKCHTAAEVDLELGVRCLREPERLAPAAHPFPELIYCTVGKLVYPAIQERWRGLNWFSAEQWGKIVSVPT